MEGPFMFYNVSLEGSFLLHEVHLNAMAWTPKLHVLEAKLLAKLFFFTKANQLTDLVISSAGLQSISSCNGNENTRWLLKVEEETGFINLKENIEVIWIVFQNNY